MILSLLFFISLLTAQVEGRFGFEYNYHVNWDGRDESVTPVQSGIYFSKITMADAFTQIRKMVLLQ